MKEPASDLYRENYDKIFRKKVLRKAKTVHKSCPYCKNENIQVHSNGRISCSCGAEYDPGELKQSTIDNVEKGMMAARYNTELCG